MKPKLIIDPIMAEMHAIKDANAKRFGGDLSAFFSYLRALESKQVESPLKTVVRRPAKRTAVKKARSRAGKHLVVS